jgi:hypothetical protein
MTPTRLSLSFVALFCASTSFADIFTGPGGRGVPVGSSDLIGTLDYSDTFTGRDHGSANQFRIYAAAIQPAPAYALENTYGNPAQNIESKAHGQGAGIGDFSFAADGPGTPGLVNGSPSYPGTSGAGSATGFTQTGGGPDYGVFFGLRQRYVVQFDAVNVSDRIDITSGPERGTIFQPQSLSIFIRGNGSGGVSLFNGSLDTPVPGYNTGLPNDGQWHNFAVVFDQLAKSVEIFIDEQSKGLIDLTTVGGGTYQNFSNAAVGVGAGLAGGQNRTWTDNFQVGSAVPEPTSILLLSVAGAGFLLRRRRA